jgi:uncharacterized protein (DUF58 family)
MKTLIRATLVLLTLLMVSSVFVVASSDPKAVQWSLALSKSDAAAGEEIEVIVSARIAPHWIVYASDFKADLGPQPTQVVLEAGDGFRLIGEIVSVNPKRKKDPTWATEFGYFEERAEFRQKIKVIKSDVAVTARIKGQLCNERDGTCTLFEEVVGR